MDPFLMHSPQVSFSWQSSMEPKNGLYLSLRSLSAHIKHPGEPPWSAMISIDLERDGLHESITDRYVS
jgi:hypothetical protein